MISQRRYRCTHIPSPTWHMPSCVIHATIQVAHSHNLSRVDWFLCCTLRLILFRVSIPSTIRKERKSIAQCGAMQLATVPMRLYSLMQIGNDRDDCSLYHTMVFLCRWMLSALNVNCSILKAVPPGAASSKHPVASQLTQSGKSARQIPTRRSIRVRPHVRRPRER